MQYLKDPKGNKRVKDLGDWKDRGGQDRPIEKCGDFSSPWTFLDSSDPLGGGISPIFRRARDK